MSKPLLSTSPDDFLSLMSDHGIRRASLVWDAASARVRASHSFLEPIAKALGDDPVDYQRHEGIFLEVGRTSGALLGAFVHNTVRGQAAGGVRYMGYDNMGAYLNDGVRLAKGMTHKNALAGLWWGGGKGVIAHRSGVDPRDPEARRRVYQDFGEMMTSLKGCYITAEDAGTNTEDMAHVFSRTRFTTCIPDSLGGSGNPSVPTARGVVSAIEAALEHRSMGTLEEKSIAIQGIGNVGGPLADFLFKKGAARVVAHDVDERRIEWLRRELDGRALEVRYVEPGDVSILYEDVDIVAPCAIGGTLNERTIPKIRAEIVCGAANNQLEVPARDGMLMRKHGVTYVPDFLANRMGIVNCADEQYGYVRGDVHFERHLGREWEHSIYQLTRRILANADDTGGPTDVEAVRLAEEMAETPHPIWGHRGQQIIDGLVAEGWAS